MLCLNSTCAPSLDMLPLATTTGAEIGAGRGHAGRRGFDYVVDHRAQHGLGAASDAHLDFFTLDRGPGEDGHAGFGVAPDCIATIGHVG